MEVSPSTPLGATLAPLTREQIAPPRYASMHTLLMRIDQLADLPNGTIWVRNEHGLLEERIPLRDSQERMAALRKAIADGKVYALWGHRQLEFEELGPEWPKGTQARARHHQRARYRHLRDRSTRVTPEAFED